MKKGMMRWDDDDDDDEDSSEESSSSSASDSKTDNTEIGKKKRKSKKPIGFQKNFIVLWCFNIVRSLMQLYLIFLSFLQRGLRRKIRKLSTMNLCNSTVTKLLVFQIFLLLRRNRIGHGLRERINKEQRK